MTTETTAAPVAAEVVNATTPKGETAARFIERLARNRAAQITSAAAFKETLAYQAIAAAEAAMRETPAYQAFQVLVDQEITIIRAIQETLAGTSGVVAIGKLKAGWEKRESVSYKPALVRELAPALAELVISETVDAKALEKLAATAIKSEKLPADTLEKLRARADVKATQAWICQANPADLLVVDEAIA